MATRRFRATLHVRAQLVRRVACICFLLTLASCASYTNYGQQIRSPDDLQLALVEVVKGPGSPTNTYAVTVSVIDRHGAPVLTYLAWKTHFDLPGDVDWSVEWHSLNRISVTLFECPEGTRMRNADESRCRRLSSAEFIRDHPGLPFRQMSMPSGELSPRFNEQVQR